MSATAHQEDVDDSNKDDENNVETATTSVNSNTRDGDVISENDDDRFNSNDLEAVTQITSASKVTDAMPKQLSPQKSNIDTAEGTSGEIKELHIEDPQFLSDAPTSSSTNSCDMDIFEKSAVEAEVSSKKTITNVQTSINASNKDVEINKDLENIAEPLAITTGNKEIVIDDVSESDIELRWTDDEDENSQPLNDQALKQLDKDLGIVNNSKDKVTKINDNPIGEDIPSILDKTDSDAKLLSDNSLKQLGQELSITNVVENTLIDTNETQIQQPINKNILKNSVEQNSNIVEEQTKSVTGDLSVTDSKTNAKNAHAMDVDVPSQEFESTVSETNITCQKSDPDGQPMDEDALKHLVKDLDVIDEDDKISEIDIDETIVDLKHLIDQDEDTIKQLGLDVKKIDDNSVVKLIEKNQQDDGTVEDNLKTSKEETKSLDAVSSEKGPIELDLSSKIEGVLATTGTNTLSGDANLSTNDNQAITMLENENKTEPSLVIDHSDATDNIKIEKTDTDEFITSDVMIDSVKINTDHRIKKPNIMLDIPSQEFDFDDDFDDLSETAKQGPSRVELNDNNMPAKTVTEIVNQLISHLDTEKADVSSTDLNEQLDENLSIHQTSTDRTDTGNKDDHEVFEKKVNKTDTETGSETLNQSEFNDHNVHKSDLKDDTSTTLIDKVGITNEIDVEISKDKNQTNVTENIPLIPQEVIDTENDSVKINTDHRINRPDVMLDIPTQEIVIDEVFDELLETEQGSSKVEKENGNITIKALPEIINEKKDLDIESNDTTKTTELNKITVASKSDNKTTVMSNITQDERKQSDKTTEEATLELGKPLEKETRTDDNTSCALKKTDLKLSDNNLKGNEPTESIEIDDAQPSTSEVAKMTPDDTEEEQELTDRLGLLAESSRVMDDDEEEEPDEGDVEDDEDDDFDPDDEESSNHTAEQSEESNPPHSELDIQEEGIFGTNADAIGLVSDSNDADDKFNTLSQDSKDNITIEENVPTLIDTADCIDEQEKVTEEIEKTEKELDDSNANKTPTPERRNVILTELLAKESGMPKLPATTSISPEKKKILEIHKPKNVVNIVDLEESSSEDDVQESQETEEKTEPAVVSVPVDQKTKSSVEETAPAGDKDKTEKNDKTGEIFNLDSDDEDKVSETNQDSSVTGLSPKVNQCVNHKCTSDETVAYYLADRTTVAYYSSARWRRRAVCQNCLDVVNARNESLVTGIKDLRPLMSLRMTRPTHQLLEISDSDSEGEDEPVGETGAKILEDQLTDLINETWSKYKMDERLNDTEKYLETELDLMQKQSNEIDQLLKDCQKATDQLRSEFYLSFELQRKELPALSVHDTPIASYACLEAEEDFNESSQLPMRYPKRHATTTIETPAKKQAIPLGYIETDTKKVTRTSLAVDNKPDEDIDVSVVRLSAESAPADLPPPGELVRPPLKVGALVYAMKNQYGAWLRGRVLEILPKVEHQYTQCRVRFEHKVKNSIKLLTGRSIAYTEPCEVRMTIGTRVIALFINSDASNKRDSYYYSGVIAEIPNPVNKYRYLVFFDDGYAQYVQHRHTRPVYESSALVWEEVHPFSRDFVCNYLMKYPERAMVRMHAGQGLTVEWNGKWWETKVLKVDAALVCVSFPDNRTEWIYRGSTRLQPLFTELQAARRGDRARLPRSTKASTKTNMPYVEYTRTDDQTKSEAQFQSPEELRRQRVVAKKSTALSPYLPNAVGDKDGVISRVVYYTPKNSVRPYKLTPHSCGPSCKRSDVLSLEDLRSYNPLTRPLLSGWERQIVRHKASREVMYRAPCGRRLRSMPELHRYLRALRSDMSVDLFDFSPNTHCLAEFVLNKSNVHKKDLSHGKENVPVPCVNYYDHSLPDFCLYNTERVPKAGVPLNLDPEFLCGCDCEDDCFDKSKCACWKMTLEGAKTIGIEGTNVGYEYRRLLEPLPSGIYECNSRCKCQSTCLNRVVQNPLQLKLQVFKTLNRGWGIRALSDVPKGAFLCIYAGNLLNDDTANLEGLNEGDEYLAELDYIEVVEAMKEGYEEDVPESIKKIDKKELMKSDSEQEESDSTDTEEEAKEDKTDKEDGDFQPGYMAFGLQEFNKRLRRRDKKQKSQEEEEKKEEDKEQRKQEKEQSDDKSAVKKEDEDCITISDDEEVRESQREPARFAAQENMTDRKVLPKYRSIRSYFGKDEACYIMDAKVQGNIGRYLNHSCSPNVFVQNVFVDTHDPRFPWVSFFALHQIKAGTELTWNYNYDVGSVPGKVLYCFCGSPNCRGRLL